MNGFARRKQQKRDSIMRAALDLFRLHGFKHVNINDIASRAGVSPVTIYNHFNGKEELVREAVKQVIADVVDQARMVLTGKGTFTEKLEYIIFNKVKSVSDFKGEMFGPVLYNDPDIETYLQDIWRNEINQMMLDFIEEGKQQGFIEKDMRPESILIYFELFRRGIFADPEKSSAINFTPALVKELNQLFLYGLNG